MTKQSQEFEWIRHPEADAWIRERLAEFVEAFRPARALAAKVRAGTGSRLVDWLDHLVIVDGDATRGHLADLGFIPEEVPAEPGTQVHYHPQAIFPRIVLGTNRSKRPQSPDLRPRSDWSASASAGEMPPDTLQAAAILVEDISSFLMTHQLSAPIEGSVLSPYRRATAYEENGRRLLAVERRGHRGFVPLEMSPDYAERYLRASQQWATRPRHFGDERQGMEHTLVLARSLVSEMGADTAAWIAFAVEREYWQTRNRAGQVQRSRQDSLGLGWANHDHHTFRSSREVFSQLIAVLETFGFEPRERFYAGAEAGWGAQVMEQPACRFTVFADVDLSPAEVEGDAASASSSGDPTQPTADLGRIGRRRHRLAHHALQARHELGTVGLWCALHGQSMLTAGLHHLAGRFDFDAVANDLAGRGVLMMEPFSDFSYLRQAFTQGERWAVEPERLERLASTGQISEAQRARFAAQGAIGSHLENIQRADGFKGFNQHTVSDIIRRTDPRAGTSSP